MKAAKVSTVRRPVSTKPRKRGLLVKCFRCPLSHPGWLRSQLRYRHKLPLCPEHLGAYDSRHATWPRCPQCNSREFGAMTWGGNVEKTKVHCYDCGFTGRALDYFDTLNVKLIAAPILIKGAMA